MARASNVLPAPGDPTSSMLRTKDRTLFYRHFTELLNEIIRFSFGTIAFAILSIGKANFLVHTQLLHQVSFSFLLSTSS